MEGFLDVSHKNTCLTVSDIDTTMRYQNFQEKKDTTTKWFLWRNMEGHPLRFKVEYQL